MAGQTLTDVRSLLAEAGLAPQHRLGQNFLIDLNLLRKVPQTAGVCDADVILEVGPGTGSLTELLLETGAQVIAVEIDRGLAELNRRRLGDRPNFTLVEGDALARKHEINPAALEAVNRHAPGPGGGRKLVANLPYQIATPLIMELLYVEPRFASLTCTIQREVADRLRAKPREEAYGPLSVITQTLATVETTAILPAKAFWPPPKVESALVHVAPRQERLVPDEQVAGFVSFVREAFLQRRKMLRRSARSWKVEGVDAIFAAADITPESRPEELSPEDWRRLYECVRARRAE